jgi:hypothetical protein
MSTRACYTFKNSKVAYHVYKHSDGYPSGAVRWIEAAIPSAWHLPRFEPDDFGAAFVAANKDQPGSVRLMPSGDIETIAPGDIAYRYEIESKNDLIWVTVFQMIPHGNGTLLWQGPLSAMQRWIERTQQR